MTLVITFLAVIGIMELVLLSKPKYIRRWLTDGLTLLLAVGSGLLLYSEFTVITIMFCVCSLYRCINLERVTHRQLQDDYVYHLAFRASTWLLIVQAVLLTTLYVIKVSMIDIDVWLPGLAVLVAAIAAVLAHVIDAQGRSTLAPLVISQRTDEELPALTVAIPARNETADLEACLSTLVRSNYSKLEILVLDDCSQNIHTPEIIRQFAHDGVRFIAGKPPAKQWLAKNFAYEQLRAEANGELILFCGVDSRFEPNSLTNIVSTMLDKRKTMMSIIPRNATPGSFRLEALMIQPGRYAWELVLPRRWLDRPPVLSCCWIAQKQLVEDAGGFAAVSRAILPERYFARYSALHQDGYSFVQSGEILGLASTKNLSDQRATAVRTRYPGLHRRIEFTALVSLIELVVLVVPYAGAVHALIAQRYIEAALFTSSCGLLSYTYYQVVRITYQRPLLRGLWLLPFAALYDIALLNFSLWQYEYSEVIWKGRNVCIPVMRVVPHLPRISASGQPKRHHRYHHRRHR